MKDIDLFVSNIIKTQQAIHRTCKTSFAKRRRTFLHLEILRTLRENPNLTMGELSQRLRLSMSSLTQVTKRLLKDKLVIINSDTKDHRINRLKITVLGEKELINLQSRFKERIAQILKFLPAKDIKELIRIHQKLLLIFKKQQVLN